MLLLCLYAYKTPGKKHLEFQAEHSSFTNSENAFFFFFISLTQFSFSCTGFLIGYAVRLVLFLFSLNLGTSLIADNCISVISLVVNMKDMHMDLRIISTSKTQNCILNLRQ